MPTDRKTGQIQDSKHFTDYDLFISENRRRINEQFNIILRFLILAGPMIAIAVRFNVFKDATYYSAAFITLFMLLLTVIHKLLLKKHAESTVTGIIALVAIDVLLVFIDNAHLSIFINWFLVPLLALLFCDLKIYYVSVAMNYCFMALSAWMLAPWYAERRIDVDTAVSYFARRIGGFTIETVMMIVAGHVLCKMITRYYRELIENNRIIHDQEIQTEKAVAANEAKSAFLSSMSHEIRTPINAVLGMNEMILRECRDENIAAYAENIRIAGSTLLGIINDILDFSKIEAGKMEIVPIEYDITTVLNDLVNMIRTRADEKGLELILDFDRKMPRMLYGDEIRIKQVITNILTNAVKYTEKGNVTFSVGFDVISGEADGIFLKVSVKDTGIGIRKEDMKRLFTQFERVDEQRNRNIEGTGLGLSITQKLLGMMGSSLSVESIYARGSKFSFALKQKVVKWEPLGDYESAFGELVKEREVYRESFISPDACILLVDDNPMNLMVIKDLLKTTRIRIETAGSGKECLLMTKQKKYDIILLDHLMPGMDGIDTLREIKGDVNDPNVSTPAICLTANAISGSRDMYINAGFDDYLTKPVDSARLEEMLAKYLPEEKIEKSTEPDKESTGGMDSASAKRLMPLIGSPIDISEGITNSGNIDAYISLLKIFYESVDVKTSEMDELVENNDINGYVIKVHALKSSARLIGAMSLGEEAQALENAGKAGNTAFIGKHHSELIAHLKALKEPLDIVFAGDKKTEDDKPDADDDLIKSIYARIRAAAAGMDLDSLEYAFTTLDKYRIPPSEAELIGKIKDAYQNFDYETIVSILDEKA